jgi:hypothetical protein
VKAGMLGKYIPRMNGYGVRNTFVPALKEALQGSLLHVMPEGALEIVPNPVPAI